MRYVSQEDLDKTVLFRLFEHAQNAETSLSSTSIAELLANVFSVKRVEMALESLESRKYVSGQHNSYSGSKYEISRSGYLSVEKALLSGNEFYVQLQEGGEDWLTANDGEWAPATDRVVGFDHNQPDYRLIATNLDSLIEDVRADNAEELSAEEKSRLLAGLQAAKSLWAASELKIVQIKVGVIMALQEVESSFATSARALAASLLVDAVKAFVKTHLHVDLDNI